MPCVAYLLVRYAWLYNAVDVDVVAEAIKNRQILASQPISLRGPASKWADPYDNIAHSLFGTNKNDWCPGGIAHTLSIVGWTR